MLARYAVVLAWTWLLVGPVLTLAELSPVLTAPLPAVAAVRKWRQLRNRTQELYSIVAGLQMAFTSDEEMGVIDDGTLSADTFRRILQRYRSKTSGLKLEKKPEDEDDYFEDADPGNSLKRIVFNPCSPNNCVARFSSGAERVNFSVPCDTASGFIPEEPQLPLSFPGNFELCESYDFVHAHFCTIETSFLIAPLLDPHDRSLFPKPKDFLLLGPLFLGKCVARQCNANLLRRRFLSGVKSTARKMFLRAKHVRLDILFLESYIEETTKVSCVKEDMLEQGTEFESLGTTMFMFLVALLSIGAVAFTTYQTLFPHTRNKYVLAFSWVHNFQALFNPMKGEYVFLNGVRVISMMWIVYGHTVLMSTIGVNVPINNPTAVDNQLQSFTMTYIRAAEYSVDTFFFMSGLLATKGIIESTFSGRLPKTNISTYITLLLIRFIRLTPLYMFVLLFYVKVLPYCGSGPYWLLNNNRKDLEHLCKHWFTNAFYFNNMYPFNPNDDGGINGCMGWTWYLANDMQFFLFVPLLAWSFLWQWRSSRGSHYLIRAARLYGPCAVLVAIQIGVTAWLGHKYKIRGTFDESFSVYIYIKPWCRMSPYVIGCCLAMYRFDRQQAIIEAQHIDSSLTFEGLPPSLPVDRVWLSPTWFRKHFTAVLGFGLTLFISFVIYDDFRCKAEPSSDCHIWYAAMFYGELGFGNWAQGGIVAYIALGYPAWGLALALLTNYAANGNGGIITAFLSHPVFTPLARLSYTVYLIHIICMQWFYTRAPAPAYSSPMRQSLDTVAFAALAFAVALFLHLLVEKPFATLLPWCLGFDRDEQRSQRMRATSMPLERELSTVGDVDSEAVIIGTPRRRTSVGEVEQPLLQAQH